jgi:hypothetical protein
MFRKILFASVAALGLMSVVVPTIDARPSHGHAHASRGHAHSGRGHARGGYRHAHYRTYRHREFGCWADANAWIGVQRSRGFQCYYEWHGPTCWVFYR